MQAVTLKQRGVLLRGWIDKMATTYAERKAKMNKLLTQTAKQYKGINARYQAFAVKEASRIRAELSDLLLSYANTDNIIDKVRMVSLLSDLDAIERNMNAYTTNAVQSVIKKSAEHGFEASKKALTLGVGNDAIVTGGAFDRINQNVFNYTINRFGADGLILSDRIWNLTHDTRTGLQQVIQSGIIRGQSVNSIVANVRKVHENEMWKVRRLVVTEGNVAHRTANAYTAQESGVVKGLRIHRGKADNAKHRCTQLELEDRYGYGKGVYVPTDPEVLNPHPNCTSFTTYELIEEGANVN